MRFLGQHGNTFSKLEVLLFLSRNPEARFSFDTLAGSPGARRPGIVEGVRSLVAEGIVREEKGANHVASYSLTANQHKRRYVEQLGTLNTGVVKRYPASCGPMES